MTGVLQSSVEERGRALTMAEEALGGRGEYAVLSARRTRWSWVAYLGRPHGPPLYCLKVRLSGGRVHEGRESTTALEYRTLSWLWSYFSGVTPFERSLPQPVAHLPSCHGVLTEYVPGRPLAESLLWGGNLVACRWSTARLRSLYYASGAWLRVLHAVGPPDWMPVRTSGMEALRSRAEKAAAALPMAVRHRIPLERLLARIQSSLDGEPDLVVSHNDYQPSNLLFHHGRIHVLDLTTVGLAPAEDDLASFLVWTVSQKQRLLGGDLAGPAALWRDLTRAFLAGHGYDGDGAVARLSPYLTVQFLERLASASSTTERLAAPLRLLSLARLSRWAGEFSTSLEEGRLC